MAGPRSALAGIVVGLGLGPKLWFAALQGRSTVLAYVADITASVGLIIGGGRRYRLDRVPRPILMRRRHSRWGKLALAGISGSVVGFGLGLGFWLAYFSLPFARG